MIRTLIVILFFAPQVFATVIYNNGSRSVRYTIAEAAFLESDYFKAERIFKELIQETTLDAYGIKSMEKLFDIAEKHGDKLLFKDIYELFKKGDTESSLSGQEHYNSLFYTLGKYFYHSRIFDTSEKFLKRITVSSSYYPRAQYILAAIQAEQKRYKQALITFDKMLQTQHKDMTPLLKDEFSLAAARMFVMLEKFSEAIVLYQGISSFSPYYLDAQKEIIWVFFKRKDYKMALSHLEALVFVNKKLYDVDSQDEYDEQESLSDLDLMKLKSLQGYIYMEQDRFEEAMKIFNEIIIHYNGIKKVFVDELKKFKVSDDLTQLISHTVQKGVPRSMVSNFEYNIFDSGEKYSIAFKDWLTPVEKQELISSFNMYYSLLKEAERIREGEISVNEEDKKQILGLVNLMNKYLKQYLNNTIALIHSRLDDIGLKAQLGRIDIIWKTKENQSDSIKNIQMQKEDLMQEIDKKFKKLVE